jgi:hypothetical protein
MRATPLLPRPLLLVMRQGSFRRRVEAGYAASGSAPRHAAVSRNEA